MSKYKTKFLPVKFPPEDHPLLTPPSKPPTYAEIKLTEYIKRKIKTIIDKSICENSLPLKTPEKEKEYEEQLQKVWKEFENPSGFRGTLNLPRWNSDPPKKVNTATLWNLFDEWEGRIDPESSYQDLIADIIYHVLCELYGEPEKNKITKTQPQSAHLRITYDVKSYWNSNQKENLDVTSKKFYNEEVIEALIEEYKSPGPPPQLLSKFQAPPQRIISSVYKGSTSPRANITSNLPRINYTAENITFSAHLDWLRSQHKDNTNEGND